MASVPRVLLSDPLTGPTPSGSSGAPRLCQDCSHPTPASPGTGCPQLLPDRCDGPAVVVFHLHSNHQRLTAHEGGAERLRHRLRRPVGFRNAVGVPRAATTRARDNRPMVWVPDIRSPHATCAYSWISPPTRSRRTTRPAGTTTADPPGPSGGACPKPRCGRCRLRCRLQGRPGARCPPFDEPVSPDRPANPACRSSGTGLSTRPATNKRLRCRSAPQYPAWTARSVAGIHRRLLPCRPASAASLCPFAMCTPLACSDYYGHSATTRRQQRTTRLPATRRRGGRRRVASHVHHHPVDEVGVQLYPGSLARGTPQPFPLASPTGHYLPAAESPAAIATGVHC
jgi:hypothetical protein